MKCKPWIGILAVVSLVANTVEATAPNSLSLNGTMYYKAQENVMGSEKSAIYLPKDQTLSNWDSMAALWFFMFAEEPVKLAQNKFGAESKTVEIENDPQNILVYFDSYNSIGEAGDPVTFQQNVWRLQQLNYNKGVMALEYSQRKLLPNQSSPVNTQPIDMNIVSSITALPLKNIHF